MKTELDENDKNQIELYYKKGVSLAGITSLMFMNGFKGMNYFELRKNIQKHLNRLHNQHKS